MLGVGRRVWAGGCGQAGVGSCVRVAVYIHVSKDTTCSMPPKARFLVCVVYPYDIGSMCMT